MTTVVTLVQDAMFTIGALGQDGTTQPEGAADQQLVLRFLQRMLDNWANDNLLVYSESAETLPLTANQATYSSALLSGGTRPVAVTGMYVLYGTVSYPISMIDSNTYNSFGIKTIAAIPQYCYYNPTFATGLFTFFPVPYAAMTAYVYVVRPLAGTLTLATDLVLPPGYEHAIVANLAKEICRPFGQQLTPDIILHAKESMAKIKRANVQFIELKSPFSGNDSNDLSYICYPW
jgi:hypothetical protein